MKTSRRKRRIGSILFFAPIIVLGTVVVLVVVNSAFTPKAGTLNVRAQAAPYHGTSQPLSVQAAVDGHSVSAPAQLSLAPGSHVVSFGNLQGYRTPPNIYSSVQAGQTSYATGVYEPFRVMFVVTNSSINLLNSTSPEILHDTTPVVWLNRSGQVVTILSNVFSSAPILPGGNFTYIFPAKTICRFWILGNSGVVYQFPVA